MFKFTLPLRNPIFWIAAFPGLILDQITKQWATAVMTLHESWPIIPGVFALTYRENYGAAWSLFSESGYWLRWLSLIVSVGLMAYAWFARRWSRWDQAGWGFIFSGAFGNGIDRFAAGKVIDFFHITLINFPVFNFADIFINVGIVCLVIGTIQAERSKGKQQHK